MWGRFSFLCDLLCQSTILGYIFKLHLCILYVVSVCHIPPQVVLECTGPLDQCKKLWFQICCKELYCKSDGLMGNEFSSSLFNDIYEIITIGFHMSFFFARDTWVQCIEERSIQELHRISENNLEKMFMKRVRWPPWAASMYMDFGVAMDSFSTS